MRVAEALYLAALVLAVSAAPRRAPWWLLPAAMACVSAACLAVLMGAP